jgi:type II secretory pathway component PulF
MNAQQSWRLPTFTDAVVITAVFSCIGWMVVPKLEAVYVSSAQALPALTRLVLMLSPGGLIAISFVLGVMASLGRSKRELRWISWVSALLVLMLGATVALGLWLPFGQG